MSKQSAIAGDRPRLLRELGTLIAQRRRAALVVVAMPAGTPASRLDALRADIGSFIGQGDFLGLLDDSSLAIVLHGATGKADVAAVGQRLFRRSALLQVLGTGAATAAFGMVMLPANISHASSLLRRAQQAARYALRTQARWVCWSDGSMDLDNRLLSRDDMLVLEVLQGLDRGEFELFYQPQLDMRSGRVRGLEALVRWHRDGRLVLPKDFVPAIEAAGFSAALGC